MGQTSSEQPRDYRRPYKQRSREHSSRIERGTSRLTPLGIQSFRAAQEAKTWFRGSMGSGLHIESYRSRQRRKNDEREYLRRLDERLMSHDQRLEDEVQRQVAIPMSQQQQAQTVPPEPNVAADHLSQRKSSCACTDVAVAEPTGIQAMVEASAPQRFPVDEITQRTPWDLQTAVKNLMFTVA